VLKVLIVEDDLMIADMIEEILVAGGYAVCGIARTVADGVALGHLHKPDLAVIDMRLADGERGSTVATQLSSIEKLGILYATGNAAECMRTASAGHGCLAKPYRDIDLLRSLELVSELVATGGASPPFPNRFKILPSATVIPRKNAHGR
jgi:DNA-binding response OmpR family regulator